MVEEVLLLLCFRLLLLSSVSLSLIVPLNYRRRLQNYHRHLEQVVVVADPQVHLEEVEVEVGLQVYLQSLMVQMEEVEEGLQQAC